MFILNKDKYLLQENVKQAKAFLKKEYDIDADKDNPIVFNYLKELLEKLPNLVYTFTKLVYNEGATDSVVEQARDIINWYKENKNIASQLPKNLTQYESLEEISDDITQLEINLKVKKFYKSLYRDMRRKVDELNETDRKKFDQLAQSFMELDDEYKKQFTPLKYFEKNNISIEEFIETLDKFVNGADVNERKKEIQKYTKDHDDVNVIYNSDNIFVVETSKKEHVCNLGSQNWCIVYSDNYYTNYLDPSRYNTQYFIFNFNLPASNPNSQFGITVDPKGKTLHGASQNKNNINVPLDQIYDMTGIPSGIIKSKYQDIYNEINKNVIELVKYAKENGLVAITERIKKLSAGENGPTYDGDIIPRDSIKYFTEDENVFDIAISNSIYYYDNIIDLFKDMFKLEDKDIVTFMEVLKEQGEDRGVAIGNSFENYKMVDAIDFINEFEDKLQIIVNLLKDIHDTSMFEYLTGSKGGYLELLYETSKKNIFIGGGRSKTMIFKSTFQMVKNDFRKFYNIIRSANGHLMEVYDKTIFSMDDDTDKSSLQIINFNEYGGLLAIENVERSKNLTKLFTFMLKPEGVGEAIENDLFYVLADRNNVKPVSEYLGSQSSDLDKVNELIGKINDLGDEEFPHIKILKDEFVVNKEIVAGVINPLKEIDSIEKLLNYLIDFEHIFSWIKFDLNLIVRAIKVSEFSLKELLFALIISKMVKTPTNTSTLSKLLVENKDIIKNSNNLKELEKDIDIFLENRNSYLKELQVYFKKSDIYNKISKDDKPSQKHMDDEISNYLAKVLDHFFSSSYNNFEKFEDYYTFFNKYDEYIDKDWMSIANSEKDRDVDYITNNMYNVITSWAGYDDERIYSEHSENNIGLDTQIVKYLRKHPLDQLTEELYYENSNEDMDVVKAIGKGLAYDDDLLNYYLEDENNFALLCLAYNDDKYKEDFFRNIGLKYYGDEDAWVHETTMGDIEGLFDQSNYSNFSLQDYYDIFDSWYDDYNYFKHGYDGGLENVTITVLKDIVKIIKGDGIELDTTVLDNYDKDRYDYKESMELYKEDKELRDFRDDIEEILKGNNEDIEFDADEIINTFNYAYSEGVANEQAYEWYKKTLSNLEPILNYFKDKKTLVDGYDSDVKVIPDIWNIIDSDVYLPNLREYTDLENFNMDDMLAAYTEANGKFEPDSSDNSYVRFDDDNWEGFNSNYEDRLYEFVPQNESVIFKYKDFLVEELDQKFVSEFEDEERAEEEWEWYNNRVDELNKEGGTIYRLVFLENMEELDSKDLGEHWCLEQDQLSNFYDTLDTEEGKLPFIIIGHLDKDSIDKKKSIDTFKELPHELEVNLKKDPKSFDILPYTGNPTAERLWNDRI